MEKSNESVVKKTMEKSNESVLEWKKKAMEWITKHTQSYKKS